MKRKKLLALLLTGIMAISSLSACGNSANTDTSSNAGASSTNTASGEASQEEPYTVRIIAFGDGTTESADAVAAELSKRTKELYNIEIELVKGYTVEQLKLILTSGEKLDLFPVMPWEMNLASLANNDQLVAMDDLLPEYAPQTLAAISESDWSCTTVNGQIYGVPMNKDKARSTGFAMRKDVVEELGIDYQSLTSLEKIEEVLRLVKEKTDYYPLVSSNGTNQNYLPYDNLGDDLGVLENVFDDSTTVVNWFETESYKNFVETMWRWGQEGLIMPDATSNTDSAMTVIGAKGFGTFGAFKPGVALQASAEAGTELVLADLYPSHSTTGNVAVPWCIPANSEKPEKAMQVLELLYNDPEMSNLLINGIEGVHYVYTDDSKTFIDFPEGKDANSIGYGVFGWACPNQQITPLRVGDPADLWEQLNDFNKDARNSPAKGFAWDNAKVLNEITACQNVVNKYKNGLELGALNPDEVLPKFITELKAAGIDTIVKEKQAQLDAWLAQK